VDEWTGAGLGLEYTELRFGTTTQEWLRLGAGLGDRVRRCLCGLVADVEIVGSSSVLGLLAKPIIDLAVGLTAQQGLTPVIDALQADGWIYRGDAGSQGGHVFVLETRPWFRVAHIHVVAYQGPEWRHYLQFRDLLRRDPAAREKYAAVKLKLLDQAPSDRNAYTAGKTDVVVSLLASESRAGGSASSA
jgi:GrpB-like predicted nucleotidyltransferase (UPF0157 family)